MDENKIREVEDEEVKMPELEEAEEGEIELDENGQPKPVYNFPWKGLIFIGVIITLMIVCIVIIGVNGGFN